jgi:hypothetical protein
MTFALFNALEQRVFIKSSGVITELPRAPQVLMVLSRTQYELTLSVPDTTVEFNLACEDTTPHATLFAPVEMAGVLYLVEPTTVLALPYRVDFVAPDEVSEHQDGVLLHSLTRPGSSRDHVPALGDVLDLST